MFRLYVGRTRSRALLFAGSRSFTSAELRYAPAGDPGAPWTVLSPREADHEYDVDHWTSGPGDPGAFFVRTNGAGLRNFRLVRVARRRSAPAAWEELIPHREDVMIEDVDVFARFYVVHERAGGLTRLHVVPLEGGGAHHVEFPEPTYDVESEPNEEFDPATYRFRYQSLITPPSVFDWEVGARRLVLLKQTEVLGGYDPARYRTERLHAPAPDGTLVPISLVCAKDAPRDGSAPMLLAGYGAYGIPYGPYFSSNRLSLLERGVAVAVAHVRGGGEMGKRWHDAGRMLNKRNTFTDFVAVADSLVREGYTARDRLVIEGGSAGGLLIGAVLNMRPDLARAAVLRVPFVDVINTMLDESLPLTVGEFEEWGNPKRPALLRVHEDVLPVHEHRAPALPRRPRAHGDQRQPGDVLGAGEVGGEAPRGEDGHAARALQDRHGRRARRRLGPLRLPPGDRASTTPSSCASSASSRRGGRRRRRKRRHAAHAAPS